MTVKPEGITYPSTRQDDLVENLHGHNIADPYRWLEDTNAPETADWVRRQNDFTEAHLAQLPERTWFRQRMSDVLSASKSGAPRKVGGRYFVSRNDGTWNQDVWYMAETLEELRNGGGKAILDPNEWSADGSAAVIGFEVSDDGHTLAYVVSEGGSDWSDYRLLDLDTGEPIQDAAIQSKVMPPLWLPDNTSYIYAAPLKEGAMTGTETSATGRWRLLLHQVGTPESSDRVLLDEPETPHALFLSEISHDGRWLAVHLHRGTERSNRLWVYPLTTEKEGTVIGEPLRVIDNDDAAFAFIRVDDDRLLCRTDLDAERGRIVSIDLTAFSTSGTLAITEVIRQTDDVLVALLPAGRELITVRLVNAVPRLDRHTLTGEHLGTLLAPPGEPIQYEGWWASPSSDEYFVAWTTPTRPSFPLHGHTGENQLPPLHGPSPDNEGLEPVDVDVTQAWATSSDGTRVPYFVVHTTGRDTTSPAPTLLWGYGGFGITIGTDYSPALAGWLSAGGTVAIANLRGGGEFGTAWHAAGRRANKQNVFDDFIASAST